MMTKEKIQPFEQKQVRTFWNEEQEKSYFSIMDVVSVLTESTDGRKYWNKLNQRKIKASRTVTKMTNSKQSKNRSKMKDIEECIRQGELQKTLHIQPAKTGISSHF